MTLRNGPRSLEEVAGGAGMWISRQIEKWLGLSSWRAQRYFKLDWICYSDRRCSWSFRMLRNFSMNFPALYHSSPTWSSFRSLERTSWPQNSTSTLPLRSLRPLGWLEWWVVFLWLGKLRDLSPSCEDGSYIDRWFLLPLQGVNGPIVWPCLPVPYVANFISFKILTLPYSDLSSIICALRF